MLYWSHIPPCWKSHVAAQFFFSLGNVISSIFEFIQYIKMATFLNNKLLLIFIQLKNKSTQEKQSLW